MTSTTPPRLLAGPPLDGRAEPYASHLARLGPLPAPAAPGDLIDTIEACGLLGRGGAGFPVARKWRAVAGRRGGRAVVLVNGAEGEPGSAKDRVLMAHRPHLVVDGAVLAADAVGADEIVLYVAGEHDAAVAAMAAAIRERRDALGRRARLVVAPHRYVAGESSAAVHFVNQGDARPTTSPPRMAERGVGGRPTLVQNVETLAHVALIARRGEAWYRSAGRLATPGTALVTVSGAVAAPGVVEIEYGTTLGEVIGRAGGATAALQAVALGGYAGMWVPAVEVRDLPLDPATLRAAGLSFGCGIVGALAARACGVAATADIMAYMAAESAGQCGPCVFGLRSIADATGRLARLEANAADLADVERWTGLVRGRGACGLPDGAADLMTSALDVFRDDLRAHAVDARCLAAAAVARVA